MNRVSLGIYISVPFCRTKCSYCNFASDVFSKAVFERYVDRVCADIANAAQTAEQMGGKFETGGGLDLSGRRHADGSLTRSTAPDVRRGSLTVLGEAGRRDYGGVRAGNLDARRC